MSPRGSNNARGKDQKSTKSTRARSLSAPEGAADGWLGGGGRADGAKTAAQPEEWGLTEADRQSLSVDQQRSKLTAQMSDLDAQITSKTQTR